MTAQGTERPARRHPIGVVSRRTGLTPDVLRAWERRYGAVEPQRIATNRRYYSDEQLERLLLLRQATLAGWRIGNIAELSDEELRDLVASDQAAASRFFDSRAVAASSVAETHYSLCLPPVQELNWRELQTQLERASVDLSQPKLIEMLLVPLLTRIGELWQEGTLRVANEHLATAVIRSFLADLLASYTPRESAPVMIVSTPRGQIHEIGALIVSVIAESEGWQTIYMGPDLPAEEIGAAAKQKQASVIALSIVYPTDDPLLVGELKKLWRLVHPESQVIIGGGAAEIYDRSLGETTIKRLFDSSSLRAELRAIRTQAAAR